MIQLKLSTEYSFGQTFAPIDLMIKRLKDLGCKAAGIVDHSTWGHVAWFNACKAAGIQPLLGVSCIVSDNDDALSMWFICADTDSLQALYTVLSKSYSNTVKVRGGARNRLYRDDVESMTDGILKFAGDITDGKWLKKIGAYVDLNPSSIILNQKKKAIAKKYKLKIVSVSDNAFISKDDADIFEIIAKTNPKTTPQYIIEDLDHQASAKKIAKLCEGLELPEAPMLSAKGDLEKMCRKGIKARGRNWWDPIYEDRMMYELDMIKSKNFESYFIIVADMVRFAKKHMLVGVSRGSAAGSLVCYLLGITEVDPIPPGLFFERFIDVSRDDLPDIDLDFPDNKRFMVFDYMAEKYGFDNVAHIGTISKFRPRSTLVHVCKVLGIPPTATGVLKITIGDNTLTHTLKATKQGEDFLKSYPEAKVAMKIEGHASHTGVHAAGLLVSNDRITNYATVDAKGIAHVVKKTAEKLGLLKIDILGLTTLTILEDSGIEVDWYNLPLDDFNVFEIFNKGLLSGIFQFDGEAMRSVCKQIEILSINDIDAVTALARPGTLSSGVTNKYIERKNGKKYELYHDILKETFGLPIYQEQTLKIVREIGGFSWADTAKVRRSFSSKDSLDVFKIKFFKGAAKNNFMYAEYVWNMISEMGSYQMNKAHTYSYSIISYWTAYLKAYHPLEFAAANLRHADEDKAIMLLREMKIEGVEHVPFDIDKSEMNWSVQDGKLYGGFTALKGIGEAKAKKLIESRDNLTVKQIAMLENSHNPYKNIFPFHTFYEDLYKDPKSYGIANAPVEIIDLNFQGSVPHGEERVFLGEIIYKRARNANEDVEVKKRGGVIETGDLEFLDLRIRDDHGIIFARVQKWNFKRLGKELLDDIPIGAHLLIRAKFYNGVPCAFIAKWKRIDDERKD